jgi:hypothetical protein
MIGYNGLVINNKKTVTMFCHTWKNKGVLKPQIVFEGVDIKCKYKTKFLGLQLTEDMKWDVHVKHTSCQLNTSYYVMQSIDGKTSVSILRNMYFVNFSSHLRYGILFCGGDGEINNNFKVLKEI